MGFQFIESYRFFDAAGLTFSLAVDGVSLALVLLTTFLMPIGLLATWKTLRSKAELFSILILELFALGSFVAYDLGLFFLFFEGSLLPLFFIIGLWGHEDRIYAAKKFFIYTFAGSVFMVLAISILAVLYKNINGYPSLNYLDLASMQTSFVMGTLYSTQFIIFMSFMISFAVKTPLVPFHTWLPDAHVQAPTMGSLILAAVLLKVGTYGIYRFQSFLFPQAMQGYQKIMMIVALVGVVYGALLAFAQKDIKKTIAYSSVSHMSLIALGLFSLDITAHKGALFQMMSHGLTTGALFLMIGMLYERFHSRDISMYGGLATKMPRFTFFFFILAFSAMAVPLTSGFVGEFLILYGVFKSFPFIALIAIGGSVLTALYILQLLRKVFLGSWRGTLDPALAKDLTFREGVSLLPIVFLIFYLGLYPKPLLKMFKLSTEAQIELGEKNVSN